jgi:hypothetical protein
MIKLIKCLDEVLGKLDLAKNNTKNVCDLNTDRGVADWLSIVKRINYIERQVFDLMSEIMENEQRIKTEACMLCAERKGE